MSDSRPILVASDFSELSQVAVTRASQLAATHDRPLTALHVINEEPLWWIVKSRDLNADELRAQLLREAIAEIETQLREAGRQQGGDALETQALARLGKSSMVIMAEAESIEAGLIVVGAHGRHVVRDWFVGTTAEKIVRAASVPVLVASAEPTHGYQKVVVAIDFSESSRAALQGALEWAPRAQFTLVHAYETWFESYIEAATYERLRLEQEEALHDRLREFAHAAGVRSDHDPDYRIIAGHPGTAVIEAAVNAHADLTVCGTQGEAGLRHLLLGSVAQHILRESKGDVLTVRDDSDSAD